MYDDDGFDIVALLESLLQENRIHVPCAWLTIDKNRLCAKITDWVGTRSKSKGGANDSIAWTNA